MENPNSKSSIQNFWSANFITLITLIIGIVLALNPGIIATLCSAAGILLILAGAGILIYYFVKKDENSPLLGHSIIFLIGGILLCIVPTLLKFLIPIFFGAWLLISSVSGMYQNFIMKAAQPKWWISFLLCLAGALIGLFVITRPTATMNNTIRMIGIAMIVHSVLRLISLFYSKNSGQNSASGDEKFIDTTATEE